MYIYPQCNKACINTKIIIRMQHHSKNEWKESYFLSRISNVWWANCMLPWVGTEWNRLALWTETCLFRRFWVMLIRGILAGPRIFATSCAIISPFWDSSEFHFHFHLFPIRGKGTRQGFISMGRRGNHVGSPKAKKEKKKRSHIEKKKGTPANRGG